MSLSTRIHVHYNVDRQSFCDVDGTPLAIEQLPRITLEQQAILALTCLHDDGQPASFGVDDVFSWAADDDWDQASEVLLLSPAAAINAEGLWNEADPTAGKLAILVDAASANLQSALGTREEIAMVGELKVYPVGSARPCYIGQMEFRARNLVDHAGVMPPEIPANHYSRSEIDALLGAYLQRSGGLLSGDLDADHLGRIRNLAGFSLTSATPLTIVDGAITPTGPIHSVDTQDGAATDELVTIAGWTGLLFLYLADAGRIVTVQPGTTPGAVETATGGALVLSRGLTLFYRATIADAFQVLAGGMSADSLGALGDVHVPAPNDGEALLWEAASGRWIAATPAGGGSTGGGESWQQALYELNASNIIYPTGARRQIVINHQEDDPAGLATLANGEVTLGAGTWFLIACAEFQFGGYADLASWFHDVTHGVDIGRVYRGSSSASGERQISLRHVSRQFTLTGPTAIRWEVEPVGANAQIYAGGNTTGAMAQLQIIKVAA